MLLVSLISYIDRNTLALLAPTILKEMRLSGEQYGFLISAFSVSYMIGNPVWGWTLDRVGLRLGMLAAVTLWTAASISHAFAAGFLGLALARAALGFGEGATFPGGLRTVIQTLLPAQRARGIAVAYSGGSLGAIVTPIVVTPLHASIPRHLSPEQLEANRSGTAGRRLRQAGASWGDCLQSSRRSGRPAAKRADYDLLGMSTAFGCARPRLGSLRSLAYRAAAWEEGLDVAQSPPPSAQRAQQLGGCAGRLRNGRGW
jgi:hypothetical protein